MKNVVGWGGGTGGSDKGGVFSGSGGRNDDGTGGRWRVSSVWTSQDSKTHFLSFRFTSL